MWLQIGLLSWMIIVTLDSGYREILVLMQVMQFGVTVAQSALSSDIWDLPDHSFNLNFKFTLHSLKQQWCSKASNPHGFIVGNGYIMMLQQFHLFASLAKQGKFTFYSVWKNQVCKILLFCMVSTLSIVSWQYHFSFTY